MSSKKQPKLIGKKVYLVDSQQWAKISKLTDHGTPEEATLSDATVTNLLRRAYAIANTYPQVIEALFSGIRIINSENAKLRQQLVSSELDNQTNIQ